ncbi:unnamed protein product, partial [Effrenium voratum]
PARKLELAAVVPAWPEQEGRSADRTGCITAGTQQLQILSMAQAHRPLLGVCPDEATLVQQAMLESLEALPLRLAGFCSLASLLDFCLECFWQRAFLRAGVQESVGFGGVVTAEEEELASKDLLQQTARHGGLRRFGDLGLEGKLTKGCLFGDRDLHDAILECGNSKQLFPSSLRRPRSIAPLLTLGLRMGVG